MESPKNPKLTSILIFLPHFTTTMLNNFFTKHDYIHVFAHMTWYAAFTYKLVVTPG